MGKKGEYVTISSTILDNIIRASSKLPALIQKLQQQRGKFDVNVIYEQTMQSAVGRACLDNFFQLNNLNALFIICCSWVVVALSLCLFLYEIAI